MLKALRSENFARLFYATLISEVGNRIHRIALLVLVYNLTNDALWVSAVLGVQLVTTMLTAPMLSAWADSQGRRRLLVVSDLLRVLLVPLIPFIGTRSLPAILLVILLIEILRNLHDPVANAVIPDLVPDEDLDAANSLMLFTDRFAEVAFVGIAGALVGLVGPAPAFWIDAVSFLLSGLVLLGLPPLLPKIEQEISYWSRVQEGITYAIRHPAIRRTLAVNFVAALFGSVERVLGVVLAISVLKVGSTGFGIMEATMALGAIVGTMLVPTLTNRVSRGRLFLTGLLGFGIMEASLGVFPVFGWVLIAYLAMGQLNMIFFVPVRSILQVNTPAHLRTRMFSAFGAVMNSAILVGTIVGGALEKPLGAPAIFFMAGIWIVIVALVTMFRGGIPSVPVPLAIPEPTAVNLSS